MKKEKSCGAVIFRREDNTILYLLLKHYNKGHWGFAKGHVEKGETEIETAEREIMEETGLNLRINISFRDEIHYSPQEGTMKKVIYFMAEADTKKIICSPEEIADFLWLPLEEALLVLTYDECKETLQKAENYIYSDDYRI